MMDEMMDEEKEKSLVAKKSKDFTVKLNQLDKEDSKSFAVEISFDKEFIRGNKGEGTLKRQALDIGKHIEKTLKDKGYETWGATLADGDGVTSGQYVDLDFKRPDNKTITDMKADFLEAYESAKQAMRDTRDVNRKLRIDSISRLMQNSLSAKDIHVPGDASKEVAEILYDNLVELMQETNRQRRSR